MGDKSSLMAGENQQRALAKFGALRDRAEANRARSILLTLAGWTSGRIAEAFGVREDTVRLWRSYFMRGGTAALKTRRPPGAAPVKALVVAEAEDVLSAPVADRVPQLAREIEARTGHRISRSRLSVVLRQKEVFVGGVPATR
jgi:transposase